MTTTTGFGTYRNRYGKTVTDRGPSPAQARWIRKLIGEKQITDSWQDYVDLFNAGQLPGRHASALLDYLFSAKSIIVPPSQLPVAQSGEPASPKQASLISRLVGEKDAPGFELETIAQFIAEGLTKDHAGRILDWLFTLPDVYAARGFLGDDGAPVTVTGTVTTVRETLTQWGESTMFIITTEDNRVAKLFTAARAFAAVGEGDTITVSGQARHDTFKGAESTVIKRPKLVTA